MIILGVDPGTAICGYGVIEYMGNRFRLLDYGVIRSSSTDSTAARLLTLYQGLESIIGQYQPEEMAVEELFFNKNVRTALTVGQARGVVLLAGQMKGLTIAEYTPLQVKQAVVGYGRADKHQVQYMVKAILNLQEIPKPDDAADALAVAICHAHSVCPG